MALSLDHLRRRLDDIDGRGYKAYRAIAGAYHAGPLTLFLDHIQGDPFAAPSKIRIRIDADHADYPDRWTRNNVRRMALEDVLGRRLKTIQSRYSGKITGSGKSGRIHVDAGGAVVLERTTVRWSPEWIEARLEVGLPAAGRRVLGRQAARLLCEFMPELGHHSLTSRHLDADEVWAFIQCVENQEQIRAQLPDRGLVAFVADGSILPRASGITQAPMNADQAVPFRSPPSLALTMDVPHAIGGSKHLTGMGIPPGVTLVVGGGYHGKSTLLQALQLGVYPHVPGDGREYVVVDPTAVKIRAEEGRRIARVDLRPFINHLPMRRDTAAFHSEDASGSTSQAANILEAIEAGCRVLLLDEDTSATNFMLRDARMQRLIHDDQEPITPFVDRVRQLYEQQGVSSILVMGGCGDYFDVADRVIMMREYEAVDVTSEAKTITAEMPSQRWDLPSSALTPPSPRVVLPQSIDATLRGRTKIVAREGRRLQFGRFDLELRCLEQLVDRSQIAALGHALLLLDAPTEIKRWLERIDALLDREGLACLTSSGRAGRHPGNLARPRAIEISAALNRLRSLEIDDMG